MPRTYIRTPDQDWYPLAVGLIAELDDEAQHLGATTPTQIIARAARARGLTPRAVVKQVLGARFLRAAYPQYLEQGARKAGYSQVEYLSKLHTLDPAAADLLVEPILNGEVPMARMRAIYDEAVHRTGGPTSNAAQTKRRAIAFDRACEAAIRAHPAQFGLDAQATLLTKPSLLDMPLNFGVVRNGRLSHAILARLGGLIAASPEAGAIVSRLSLIARRADRTYLLVPATADDLAQAVVESLRTWGVDRVSIATVQEQAPHTLVEYGDWTPVANFS